MLTYMNSGLRDYYSNPIPTYQRGAWEIQAVLKGRIRIAYPESGDSQLTENTLWIFPPGSRHGWEGIKNQRAEILVFHFSRVSRELAEIVEGSRSLGFTLKEEEALYIRNLYRELYPEYSSMGPLYDLKSRICADRLALLFCSRFENRLNSQHQTDKHIVEKAIALFSSELEHGITIKEISERIGFSVPHLRRLFHSVTGGSPRSCFDQIRMKRAEELCEFTDYSLGEIARACGYAEHSSFTKAYVRYWKIPPSRLRESRDSHK